MAIFNTILLREVISFRQQNMQILNTWEFSTYFAEISQRKYYKLTLKVLQINLESMSLKDKYAKKQHLHLVHEIVRNILNYSRGISGKNIQLVW